MQMQFAYVPKGQTKSLLFAVPPVNTQLLSSSQFKSLEQLAAPVSRAFNQANCAHSSTAQHTPSSFDLRQEFATYLPPISNQGACGSCFVFATCNVLAARFALMRNQRVVPLSAAYLLFCAHLRTIRTDNPQPALGCYGGNLAAAFWFTELDGVVAASCARYELADWTGDRTRVDERLITDPVTGTQVKMSCAPTACVSSPKETPWLYRSAVCYIVAGTPETGGDEKNIRSEIYYRGPVATGYEVRQDFLDYWKALLEGRLSGEHLVFQPRPALSDEENPLIGGHAVMLVGFGRIGTVDYWVVANSWGVHEPPSRAPHALDAYGLNGYFLMQRGCNAGGIEGNVVASLPAIDPAYITATGHRYSTNGLKLCNFNAFDINAYTLDRMGLLQYVPDVGPVQNEYIFAYPPPAAPTQVNQFVTCPNDRPVRCPGTGLCVVYPADCGKHHPTQGAPYTWQLPSGHKASAREFAAYVQALPPSKQLLVSSANVRKSEQHATELQHALGRPASEAYVHPTTTTTSSTDGLHNDARLVTFFYAAAIVAVLLVAVLGLQGARLARLK